MGERLRIELGKNPILIFIGYSEYAIYLASYGITQTLSAKDLALYPKSVLKKMDERLEWLAAQCSQRHNCSHLRKGS